MHKKGCFINFTNHSSQFWDERQRREAYKYGTPIKDIPFPLVPAEAGEEEVFRMAQRCVEEIKEEKPSAVLCQGEFTLAYQVITLLIQSRIPVVAACSERLVQEEQIQGKTIKHAEYKFVRFREYRTE